MKDFISKETVLLNWWGNETWKLVSNLQIKVKVF